MTNHDRLLNQLASLVVWFGGLDVRGSPSPISFKRSCLFVSNSSLGSKPPNWTKLEPDLMQVLRARE